MTTRAGPGLIDAEGTVGHPSSRTPAAPEAEAAVLGAMFADREAAERAAASLTPDDFHDARRRRIFAAGSRVHERGGAVDAVSVTDELRSADELDAAGGMEYVAKFVDAWPDGKGLDAHVAILSEKRAQRQALEVLRDAEKRVREARSGEVGSVLTTARETLEGFRGPTGLEGRTWDLADVVADPEGLRLPDELLPGVAVPEHLLLYCGDPKVGGKTSFLAYGAGAVATGGRFLGRRVRQGTVLWVAGEGSRKHVGRYFAQAGFTRPLPESFVGIDAGADPLGELERAVDRHQPDLVVIDTLGSWTAPLDVDLNSPEVAEPLKRVERVARSGPAVVMVHWGRKADGDPAGHHTIKAIPDAIRVVEEGEIDRERVVKGHGRWHLPTIRYRLEEAGDHPEVPDLKSVRFRRVDPERDLEERIMDFLEDHPDASKSAILEGVGGARRAKKVEALDGLKRAGIVVVDTSGRAHTHRIAHNPHGHGTATVSEGSGHGGTGTGGVTVADGGPPSPKGGDPSATVAEPVGEDRQPRRCACGNTIGFTSMVCGKCKKGRAEVRSRLPDPETVVQVGETYPHTEPIVAERRAG